MLGALGIIDGVLGIDGIDGGFIPPPLDMLDIGLIGGTATPGLLGRACCTADVVLAESTG